MVASDDDHLQQAEPDMISCEAEPCLSLELSLGGRSSSSSSTAPLYIPNQKQNSINICSAAAMAAASACSFFFDPAATANIHQPSNSSTYTAASCNSLKQRLPIPLSLWDKNVLNSSAKILGKQNPPQSVGCDHYTSFHTNLPASPAVPNQPGPLKRKEISWEEDPRLQGERKKIKAGISYGQHLGTCSSSPIFRSCNDEPSVAAFASLYSGGAVSDHLLKDSINALGGHPINPLQSPTCSVRDAGSLLFEGSPISLLPSASMPGRNNHIHEGANSRRDVPDPAKQKLNSFPAELEGAASCQSTISNEELEMGLEMGCPTTRLLGKPTSANAKFSCLAMKNPCNANSVDVESSDHEQSSSTCKMNELESPRSRCGSNSDMVGSVDSSVADQNMPSMCSSMQNMHENRILSSAVQAPYGSNLDSGHPSLGNFTNPFFWNSSLMSAPVSLSKLPDVGGGSTSSRPHSNQSALQSTQPSTTSMPACELSLGLPSVGKDAGSYPSGLVRQPLMPKGVMSALAVDVSSSSGSHKAFDLSSPSLTKILTAGMPKPPRLGFKEQDFKPYSCLRRSDVVDAGVASTGHNIAQMHSSMEVLQQLQKPAKTVRFCGVDIKGCVEPPTRKAGDWKSSLCIERNTICENEVEARKSETKLGTRDAQLPHKTKGSTSVGSISKLGVATTTSSTSSKERPLPRVSTTGAGENGKTIHGVMYITEKMQARLVCSCHGMHMTPAEFVQHSGSSDLSNPERRIVVEYLPFAGGLISSTPPS